MPKLERLEDRVLLNAGDLDPSFGVGGIVTTDFMGTLTSSGQAVALQGDGKIVMAGSVYDHYAFGLARYNADGSLDAGFGTDGRVETHFGALSDEFASAIAVQADGKIVVVGSSGFPFDYPYPSNFAVARFNTDGSLDDTFGAGGRVTTQIDGFIDNSATGVVVQADGKIVVAGVAVQAGRPTSFAVVRYDADGQLDESFGAHGQVTTAFNSLRSEAHAVALQADGAIVVAGSASGQGSYNDFAIARYLVNGSLDATFGNGGKVTTQFADDNSEAYGIAIQSNGRIVAGGFSGRNTGSFALARYNMDGSLDGSFGTGGKVTSHFVSNYDAAYSITLQADGKIVAAGTVALGIDNKVFAVARFQTDGSLDDGFGSHGHVFTDFDSKGGLATSVAVQGNGRIVVAGHTNVVSQSFALARYQTDGSLDAEFGLDGRVLTNFQGSLNDLAQGVALQPDGKIVAVGGVVDVDLGSTFALVRYNPDGSLDAGFGTGGRVRTSFNTNGFDAATGVIIQGDGKILVIGVSFASFALARYNSDGSLDPSFGNGGLVTTYFPISPGGFDTATGVALQPDGKIVVSGIAETYEGNYFVMARYNTDGGLDPSFGNGGLIALQGATFTAGAGVILQDDGKIVVSSYGHGLALLRFNADGSLDPSFHATASFPSFTFGFAAQPDGKLLVAGGSYVGDYEAFALARYNRTGPTLDTTFGIGGRVTTTFGSADAVAKGVVLEPDGKIVLIGTVTTAGEPTQFALARYNPDGSLDMTFGIDGRVTTHVGSGVYGAAGAAVQPDGNIVVVGTSFAADGDRDFALARYLGDDPRVLSGAFASASFLRWAAGFLSPSPVSAARGDVPALPDTVVVDRVFTAQQEQPPLLSASRHAVHAAAWSDPFGGDPWLV